MIEKRSLDVVEFRIRSLKCLFWQRIGHFLLYIFSVQRSVCEFPDQTFAMRSQLCADPVWLVGFRHCTTEMVVCRAVCVWLAGHARQGVGAV